MNYEHTFLNGSQLHYSVGKVVCIGKNYRSTSSEPIEQSNDLPVLFMKPSCSLFPLEQQIRLPYYSPCYYEVELAVLIGSSLDCAEIEQVESAIAGYAIALDLTLKELLDEQKRKGHPWELAKSFDRSCPISPFVHPDDINAPDNIMIQLSINGEIKQKASTELMNRDTIELIALISKYFKLYPGDVILTGTPAGAGILPFGSTLSLKLDNNYHFKTSVL